MSTIKPREFLLLVVIAGVLGAFVLFIEPLIMQGRIPPPAEQTGIALALSSLTPVPTPTPVHHRAGICGNGTQVLLPVQPLIDDNTQGLWMELNLENTQGMLGQQRTVESGPSGLYFGASGHHDEGTLTAWDLQVLERCLQDGKGPKDHINAIIFPSHKTIAVATDNPDETSGGVWLFQKERWQLFNNFKGDLPDPRTYTLFRFRGQVCAGTINGIACLPEGNTHFVRDLGLPKMPGPNNIHAAVEANGELWLFTVGNGVYRLQKGATAWIHYNAEDARDQDKLLSNSMRAAAYAPQTNTLWMVSDGGGVSSYHFAADTWQTFPVESGVGQGGQDVAIDILGRPWVATTEGVFVLESNHWSVISPEGALSIAVSYPGDRVGADKVIAVMKDQTVNIWQVPQLRFITQEHGYF